MKDGLWSLPLMLSNHLQVELAKWVRETQMNCHGLCHPIHAKGAIFAWELV
jgi:hypothetical protein